MRPNSAAFSLSPTRSLIWSLISSNIFCNCLRSMISKREASMASACRSPATETPASRMFTSPEMAKSMTARRCLRLAIDCFACASKSVASVVFHIFLACSKDSTAFSNVMGLPRAARPSLMRLLYWSRCGRKRLARDCVRGSDWYRRAASRAATCARRSLRSSADFASARADSKRRFFSAASWARRSSSRFSRSISA